MVDAAPGVNFGAALIALEATSDRLDEFLFNSVIRGPALRAVEDYNGRKEAHLLLPLWPIPIDAEDLRWFLSAFQPHCCIASMLGATPASATH